MVEFDKTLKRIIQNRELLKRYLARFDNEEGDYGTFKKNHTLQEQGAWLAGFRVALFGMQNPGSASFKTSVKAISLLWKRAPEVTVTDDFTGRW